MVVNSFFLAISIVIDSDRGHQSDMYVIGVHEVC